MLPSLYIVMTNAITQLEKCDGCDEMMTSVERVFIGDRRDETVTVSHLCEFCQAEESDGFNVQAFTIKSAAQNFAYPEGTEE